MADWLPSTVIGSHQQDLFLQSTTINPPLRQIRQISNEQICLGALPCNATYHSFGITTSEARTGRTAYTLKPGDAAQYRLGFVGNPGLPADGY